MKTTLTNHEGLQFEVDLYFPNPEFQGRGGWNLLCRVTYAGEERTFRRYMTQSEWIDNFNDLRKDSEVSYDDLQKYLREGTIGEIGQYTPLEEAILQWCKEIAEIAEVEERDYFED